MPYSTTGLPVIPYTLTTTYDGVKYETHVLTNTCQVITEDGVPLCDILDELVTNETLEEQIKRVTFENPVYEYKGILQNRPGKPAIDQLLEKVGNQDGDVYLVQRSEATQTNTPTPSPTPVLRMNSSVSNLEPTISTMELNATGLTRVSSISSQTVNNNYDMYTWSEALGQWIFFGSTERTTADLPETLSLFPDTLGRPGQTIMVSSNGKTLEWRYPDASTETAIEGHNGDVNAHPELLRELSTKGDKLKIVNSMFIRSEWVWDDAGYYSLVFTHPKLVPNVYFEITPISISNQELEILRKASIHPIYEINSTDTESFAIIHADHVPQIDIAVCVKIYGSFD